MVLPIFHRRQRLSVTNLELQCRRARVQAFTPYELVMRACATIHPDPSRALDSLDGRQTMSDDQGSAARPRDPP
jgi:hypothetical protein